MRPGQLSRIDKILHQVNKDNTIPPRRHADLENRLVITCQDFPRQKRHAVAQPVAWRYQNIRKRASTVYCNVLDSSPSIYLAFILAISPDACLRLEPSKEFFERYEKTTKPVLNNNARSLLVSIANRCRIDGNRRFQKLLRFLFLESSYSHLLVEMGLMSASTSHKTEANHWSRGKRWRGMQHLSCI